MRKPKHAPYARPQRSMHRIAPFSPWEKVARARKASRDQLYQYKRQQGPVLCYVCGLEIKAKYLASLEHIQPLSKGGVDDSCNYELSHQACNLARGNNLEFSI